MKHSDNYLVFSSEQPSPWPDTRTWRGNRSNFLRWTASTKDKGGASSLALPFSSLLFASIMREVLPARLSSSSGSTLVWKGETWRKHVTHRWHSTISFPFPPAPLQPTVVILLYFNNSTVLMHLLNFAPALMYSRALLSFFRKWISLFCLRPKFNCVKKY